MASNFPAREEGVCVRSAELYKVGTPIHWDRTRKGMVWICAPGVCNCDDPHPLGTILDHERHSPVEGDDGGSGEAQADSQSEGSGTQGNAPASDSGFEPAEVNIERSGNPLLDALLDQGLDKAIEDAINKGQGQSAQQVQDALDKIKAEQQKQAQKASEQLRKKLEKDQQEIQNAPPTRIIVEKRGPGGEVEDETELENQHHRMPQLLEIVKLGYNAYLHGPPGTGKSTATKKVAEALGLEYAYISLNPQTPDSRLLGFMNAEGGYVETEFRRLYENGGLFCIDEMDNASASLLTTLNSCLENGLGAFPDGMIQRHDDFIVVCCGNTAGRGADWRFPDRRVFDSAFSERFKYLDWPVDEALEAALVRSLNPHGGGWLKWVRAVRKHCEQAQIPLIVSPRAAMSGADFLASSTLDLDVIAESVLFKGLDDATKESILAAVPLPKVVEVEKQEEEESDEES